MSELERKVGELETDLRQLSVRLDEMAKQTNEHNHQLSVLSSKLDEIREAIKELRAMPDTFVPRPEMQANLNAVQTQITLLQQAVATAAAASAENNKNYIDLLKGVHTNTMATYGTLITVVIALVGLFLNVHK